MGGVGTVINMSGGGTVYAWVGWYRNSQGGGRNRHIFIWRSPCVYTELLTCFDGGCIHQGCWGWGQEESVAGTVVSRIRVAFQSPHVVTVIPLRKYTAVRSHTHLEGEG